MINKTWLITAVAGALIGAFAVYQVKKHTKGILDDD
jgi:hypothetical protein